MSNPAKVEKAVMDRQIGTRVPKISTKAAPRCQEELIKVNETRNQGHLETCICLVLEVI